MTPGRDSKDTTTTREHRSLAPDISLSSCHTHLHFCVFVAHLTQHCANVCTSTHTEACSPIAQLLRCANAVRQSEPRSNTSRSTYHSALRPIIASICIPFSLVPAACHAIRGRVHRLQGVPSPQWLRSRLGRRSLAFRPRNKSSQLQTSPLSASASRMTICQLAPSRRFARPCLARPTRGKELRKWKGSKPTWP